MRKISVAILTIIAFLLNMSFAYAKDSSSVCTPKLLAKNTKTSAVGSHATEMPTVTVATWSVSFPNSFAPAEAYIKISGAEIIDKSVYAHTQDALLDVYESRGLTYYQGLSTAIKNIPGVYNVIVDKDDSLRILIAPYFYNVSDVAKKSAKTTQDFLRNPTTHSSAPQKWPTKLEYKMSYWANNDGSTSMRYTFNRKMSDLTAVAHVFKKMFSDPNYEPGFLEQQVFATGNSDPDTYQFRVDSKYNHVAVYKFIADAIEEDRKRLASQ